VGILGIEGLILEFMPKRNFGVGKDKEISLSFAQFLLQEAGKQAGSDEIPSKYFTHVYSTAQIQ